MKILSNFPNSAIQIYLWNNEFQNIHELLNVLDFAKNTILVFKVTNNGNILKLFMVIVSSTPSFPHPNSFKYAHKMWFQFQC